MDIIDVLPKTGNTLVRRIILRVFYWLLPRNRCSWCLGKLVRPFNTTEHPDPEDRIETAYCPDCEWWDALPMRGDW